MNEPTTQTVDYRTLLRKYIVYVRDCEGSNYLMNGIRGYRGDTMFTPEEWAELLRVAGDKEGNT